MKEVTIHTDGACEGNPGPGAWAAVLACGPHQKQICGSEPATTNNRMELQAAISALESLKEPCLIRLFTDSQYVKGGMTKWISGWISRGWVTAAKQPVKNEDLWRKLSEVASAHEITWEWVKGHAGHPTNELCDQLARDAIEKLRTQYTREDLARYLTSFKERA